MLRDSKGHTGRLFAGQLNVCVAAERRSHL
jgi:hypothetical protein